MLSILYIMLTIKENIPVYYEDIILIFSMNILILKLLDNKMIGIGTYFNPNYTITSAYIIIPHK